MQIFFILFTFFLSIANASLHSQFRHFEEISTQNIKVTEKSDTKNIDLKLKLVHFSALQKDFRLQLFPDTSILSQDFEVQLVNAAGKSTPTQIPTDVLYSGHEENNPKNKVNAVNHKGLWYFYIWTPEDVFLIEPVSRLDPQRTGNQLIAYKSRDQKSNTTESSKDNTPFCRVSNSNQTQSFQEITPDKSYMVQKAIRSLGNKHHESKSPRQRRKADHKQDTCGVFVVVDYETYRGVGQKSPASIFMWLSHLLQNVDTVLRLSGLQINGITYGVKMRGLMIHTEYTNVAADHTHYNMENNQLSDTETLSSLMDNPEFARYCLAHLITQRRFGGILGRATIATINDQSGICIDKHSGKSRNVGFTTPIDGNGTPLPIDKHVITMSHEIGHNFGALHDPDDVTSCAPGSTSGGKYLMWPMSDSQPGPNRKLFSTGCSLPMLKEVMMAKTHKCFESRNSLSKFCGDGRVGQDEECDSGMYNAATKDKCCTAKCRFSSGAVCSPNNHPCCTQDCQVAPNTQVCTRDVVNACVKESLCDGVDASKCPQSLPKPDGFPCRDNGTCWQGTCIPFCKNLEDDNKMMCKFCCLIKGLVKPTSCTAMSGTQTDDTKCQKGLCQDGVCKSIDLDTGLKLGKKSNLASEKESDDHSPPNTYVVVFIFVASATTFIVLLATLMASSTNSSDSEVTREFTPEEVIAINELRQVLQNLLGHLNEAPDESENPNTAIIKEAIAKERRKVKKNILDGRD